MLDNAECSWGHMIWYKDEFKCLFIYFISYAFLIEVIVGLQYCISFKFEAKWFSIFAVCTPLEIITR